MSVNVFESLVRLPPDALFDLKRRYTADKRDNKVDLGIGAYRDDNGKPWVLPCVAAAEKMIHEDPDFNHEYLGIAGLNSLTTAAAKVLLGSDSEALTEERVVSVQTLSGTGALHTAARLILAARPDAVVYVPDPTWGNHFPIFNTQGLKTETYPYWDKSTKSLNMKGLLATILQSPEGSVFLLHTCAHNPTGMDPTRAEWEQIIQALADRGHMVLFDTAYQGFASGDLDNDAFSLRFGVSKLASKAPVLVCQSFAKNVGMYGERVGVFHVVMPRADTPKTTASSKATLTSQLNRITRSECSNPPAYGAKIVSEILNTPELTEQWKSDMVTMSTRIKKMRHMLRDKLLALRTPGNWDHIVEQCGMFSYTGLSKEMVEKLEKEHAVYMVSSGRASIAGINENNIDHVASAIHSVVSTFCASKL
ncbi:HFL077Wp [Eremothecium sinecaudum]|uniref:Aspartate aminotransferase n=1 Tax=Eremothecium sinecaudum TaxID=45286 RepID=A0A0X8HUJ6_9SACH|nr:HFL077Wp [Eremothecium sinecaudum]AMD21779.1 HFL077Wp [Eremothecium sinecaudum]